MIAQDDPPCGKRASHSAKGLGGIKVWLGKFRERGNHANNRRSWRKETAEPRAVAKMGRKETTFRSAAGPKEWEEIQGRKESKNRHKGEQAQLRDAKPEKR